MSHFLLGIIKVVILEASAFLLLLDRALGHGADAKWLVARRRAFIAVAVLALAAFTNFGEARGNGAMVHTWEQFHFYMGAKYLKEVGWFDLYKAALVADSETVNRLASQQTIREIHNFELIPASQAFIEAARIKGQFSPERWESFKQDWMIWAGMPVDWGGVLNDHGNSNSPAWAILATPIANLLPLTRSSQVFIAGLDIFLVALLGYFLFKTFEARHAAIAVVIFACTPIAFDYLAGSFLRWDWLFAVGMCAVFLKRQKYAAAGAFLAYAVATKLFPLFFGIALAFHWASKVLKEKKLEKKYVRFLASGAVTGVILFAVSSAMFGGPKAWGEYKERIAVAQVEKYYTIQYSLRTVYLQVSNSTFSELRRTWFFPGEIKQARADVDINDQRVGFFIVQLLFTALIAALAWRGEEVSALLLGPLLVFTWLVVNMYYWNMLALTALAFALRDNRRSVAAVIWLHFNFALFFVYQHTRYGHAEGYIVALFIALGILAFGGCELWLLTEEREAAQKEAAAAPAKDKKLKTAGARK